MYSNHGRGPQQICLPLRLWVWPPSSEWMDHAQPAMDSVTTMGDQCPPAHHTPQARSPIQYSCQA